MNKKERFWRKEHIKNEKQKGATSLYYIGKIDKEKIGYFKNKITTDEVIITYERIKHIQERHPRRLRKIF